MKPGFQCVITHSNPGFITSWRGPGSWIVMLLTPVWPESGFLPRGTSVAGQVIVSQVALSVGLPSVLIPLVVLTSRRANMGALVNRRATFVAAIAVPAAGLTPAQLDRGRDQTG